MLSQAQQVKNRGYYGLVVWKGKYENNLSCLLRSAHIFHCSFIVIVGGRYKRFRADTTNASKHIPLYECPEEWLFDTYIPKYCQMVAVEKVEYARPLETFQHPEQAVYILGPEDGNIPDYIMKKAHHRVILPGEYCLNQSVTGSIVMYDRIQKRSQNV